MPDQSEALRLVKLIGDGVYLTYSVHAVAKLGIADMLLGGPQTAEELATDAGAHAPSLYRVLRALASVGIFAEDERGRFGLTEAGRLLASGPGSLRGFGIVMGEAWHHKAWGSFLHGVITGENPWSHATGQTLFEYLPGHPDQAAMFADMMTGLSAMEAAAVVDAYPFSGMRTIVDVAGGRGLLLAKILEKHLEVRGILFDLPHVIASAGQFLSGEVTSRCEIVSGDMFQKVPAGADAYLLKNILHDWEDEPAISILANIRQAMADDGKVLVLQEALPAGNTPSAGKILDMAMLLIGGRERTRAEYERLFQRAGLKITAVIDTSAHIDVIEGTAIR